jgi:formylglycine-generating enzyme required for sulfatase activity
MQAKPARYFLILLVLIVIYPALSIAATQHRSALVIGNSAYSAGPLKNPVNDAADMATALKGLGFNVNMHRNANHQTMENAIREFGGKLRKNRGVGLFYYAGHGMQIGGVNYLIPVGARVDKESDVKFQAVNADIILAEMENADNGMNIVLLDACRDNPFARSFRSATRGLAIISNAPTGTFISYSTGPNQLAKDGEGRNSPYTKALLENIAMPGLNINKIFMNVRSKIMKSTGQVPWELSSLVGDFYFIPPKGSVASVRDEAIKASQAIDAMDEENQRLDTEKEVQSQAKLEQKQEKKTTNTLSTSTDNVLAHPPELSHDSLFTDPTTVMQFVFVKGGCYQMGDTFWFGKFDKKPVHDVCVSDFYIGKYEVTQGEWQKIMGYNPSYFGSCGENCPVERVSWNDAQDFIKKLNSLTGKRYRLPTEAEWEYAAKSGGKSEKYAGDSDVDTVAWYRGNSSKETHPVGQKQPNGLGLFDMSGNVWEWCNDLYGSDYYKNSPQNNPDGPSLSDGRVLRGGSWSDNAYTSDRYWDYPVKRIDYVGLRLSFPLGQ